MFMPRNLSGTALALLLLTASAATADTAPDYASEGRRWWSHVRYLADDKLEGRNTGSAAYLEAARYVADAFRQAGLQPGSTGSYLQPVAFQSRTLIEEESEIALIQGRKKRPLSIGDDLVFTLRGGLPARRLEAPLIFVGYGLTVPEKQYDDLKGLDLKGKVVVYLLGGPPEIPGALRSHYGALEERWRALSRAGAIGMIGVQNPKDMDLPWERTKLTRKLPALILADPTLQEAPELQLNLRANPARMDRLLAGSGYSFAEILTAADGGRALPHFNLPGILRVRSTVKTASVESVNVVGLLPGSDPRRKDEYVVLSAHLDHLGVGEPIAGDRIYNGAMDNASGVAALVETARILQGGAALGRPVLFVAVCGEEKGLLGSKYFANHPAPSGAKPIANLNIDMFLPLYPLRVLTVLGADESSLITPLGEAATEAGVTLQPDPEPNRNRFVRSDQYSFIRQGIPAVALKFGYEQASPEEKIQKQWLKERYHAPADDLSQPVDLEAAAHFNRILASFTTRVANQPQRPHWNNDSFFRRFAPGERTDP